MLCCLHKLPIIWTFYCKNVLSYYCQRDTNLSPGNSPTRVLSQGNVQGSSPAQESLLLSGTVNNLQAPKVMLYLRTLLNVEVKPSLKLEV